MDITQEEISMLAIPAEYVPIDFQMDPKTDDLVPGSMLRDQMIVLFEETWHRGDPQRLAPDHPHYYASSVSSIRESARWCRVSFLQRRGPIISFIGIYADGTKASRTYNETYCWFVKK